MRSLYVNISLVHSDSGLIVSEPAATKVVLKTVSSQDKAYNVVLYQDS